MKKLFSFSKREYEQLIECLVKVSHVTMKIEQRKIIIIIWKIYY